MGQISSIQLFHNKLRVQKKLEFEFTKKLKSSCFTAEQLFLALKNALPLKNGLTIRAHSNSSFEIVQSSNDLVNFDYETFNITEIEKNTTSIKTSHFSDTLAKALSILTIKDIDVSIYYNGKHKFYNPKTISEYKDGHYHYAATFDEAQINEYITNTVHQFKKSNHYWNLTIFLDLCSIEINNHSSTLYQDSDTNDNPLFHIAIKEIKTPLKISEKASYNENNSYYYDNLTPVDTFKILENILKKLITTGVKEFLTFFTPYHIPYSDIEVIVKHSNSQQISDLLEKCSTYILGNKIFSNKIVTKNHICLKTSYSEKPEDSSIIISNDDIKSGHIYLGKLYDFDLFEKIQETIAINFCPCYIQTEDYPFSVYYKNDNDKPLIEKYLKTFPDHKNWLESFTKVP